MFMKRKGQSILEYVIVLIAIVACVAVAATWIKSGVSKGMDNATTAVNTSAANLLNK